MASRPIWRGHLRLALVSCPVALYSAKHDRGTVRFHLVNPATGNRIRMVTQDAETEEPLSRGDLVKGYEYQKGHYVTVTDEDIDSVKVESSSMMNVEKFVDAGSLDPIYFDASYYLAPDGKAGVDVYAVLREAIAKTGRVALARVAISQRERTIAIRPMGRGLVAQTLHEDRDLNESAPLFEDADQIRTDPQMVALATQLIDRQTGRYDPADVEDRYETRLRAMLEAKVAGLDVHVGNEAAPAASNVVDLMAALRTSLGQGPDTANAVAQDGVAENREPSKMKKAGAKRSAVIAEDVRRQPALKLPLAGGKKSTAAEAAKSPTERSTRSRRRA